MLTGYSHNYLLYNKQALIINFTGLVQALNKRRDFVVLDENGAKYESPENGGASQITYMYLYKYLLNVVLS